MFISLALILAVIWALFVLLWTGVSSLVHVLLLLSIVSLGYELARRISRKEEMRDRLQTSH